MNLVIPSDSASPGLGLVDGSAPAGSPGAPPVEPGNPSGPRFGAWMTLALQAQGQPTGLVPGEMPEDASPQPLEATPEASMSMGLDSLMAASLPAMQQISVGPHLQVITARGQAPDSESLSDFASQQGMGAETIAWLMGLQGQTTVSPTPSGAAPSPGNVLTALTGLPPAAVTSLDPPLNPGAAPQATPEAATSATTWASLTSAVAAPPLQAPSSEAASSARLAALGSLGGAALASAWREGLGASPEAGSGVPPEVSEDASARLPTAAGWMLAAQARWLKTEPGSGPLRTPAEAWAGSLPEGPIFELDLEEVFNTPSAGASERALDSALGASVTEHPHGLEGEGIGTQRASLSASGQTRADPANNGPASPMASDRMQQLSEKMADAIGERMRQELERGHWSLRLMLKPAHLGHIEVEMRLRAGELDATFAAPQAATRELLQEGLSRLKDSLSQAGMDVANLDVKNGQNRQNGGDSTPGQRQSATHAQPASPPPDAGSPAVESVARPRRSDGWDVLV